LDRLRHAVKQAVKADILTLEPARPGQVAMIEVSYHIYAPGRLYLYTNTEGDKKQVKGLLRGYEIDWTITVRPPRSTKPFVCKIGSQPLTSLTYESAPHDPD